MPANLTHDVWICVCGGSHGVYVGAAELEVPGVHVHPLYFGMKGTKFILSLSPSLGSLAVCTY